MEKDRHTLIGTRYTMRRADRRDAKELASLAARTFSDTFAHEVCDEDMASYVRHSLSPERMDEELACQESFFFLVHDEEGDAERPIAYMKINIGAAQTEAMGEDACEIQRVYVLKEYHGRRIGTAMVDYAIAKAHLWGYRRVWLGFAETNKPAKALYTSRGFQVVGEHRFVLGNEIQTDLVAVCDLDKIF